MHKSKIPDIVTEEDQNHHGRVIEGRTRDLDVPRSVHTGVKKKYPQLQSEKYHHQSLCTRVKYLKLSQLKCRSNHKDSGRVQTRDQEVPSSISGVAK